MTKEVAIIGCGPAGLLAAHAAELQGFEPVIYSKEVRKSPHANATYLHAAIPELTSESPDANIRFAKVGDGSGYAAKVYGEADRPTSWEKFDEGCHPAWALAPVYGDLWSLYRGSVKRAVADDALAVELVRNYGLVINTAPANCLCHDMTHEFRSRDIWVKDGAPKGVPENTMVYNGSPRWPWYRSSDIFGTRSTEYPCEAENHDPDLKRGIKVMGTNCDCHPAILRAGRWGTWEPGVLIHHAFESVSKLLLEV
jgi:hypothetical protein